MYMMYVWWFALILLCCLLVFGLSAVIPVGQQRINTIMKLYVSICIIVLTAIGISRLGLVSGVGIAFVIVFIAAFLSQRPFVLRISFKIYDQLISRLRKIAKSQAWLDYFSSKSSIGARIGLASHEELASTIDGSVFLKKEDKTLLSNVSKSLELDAKAIMRPISETTLISDSEIIGPLLLDELHHAGQDVFPIINDKQKIIGAVKLSSLIDMSSLSSNVSDVSSSSIIKIRPDMPIRAIIDTMIEKNVVLAVVHDQDDVGVITQTLAIESLLGKKPS